MRKLGVLLILAVVMSTFTTVLAEEIDLSRYDNDALILLLDTVQQEIINRGIERSAVLIEGKYCAGVDFPAGTYVLTIKTDDKQHGIVWISSPSDDLEKEYPSVLYELFLFNEEKTFRITIEEGGILYLPFEATLTIPTRVMFK